MNIIAGKYKGRRLQTPKGDQTRPTTSLVRKALFDICQESIEEARVLDLFAGSGAIGFEALSRGASHVTFVENHPQATRALQENLRLFKLDISQAHLIRSDVLTTLKRLIKQDSHFDLIYIDPPYDQSSALIPDILQLINTSTLLSPEGQLFLEERQGGHSPLQALHLHHLHLISSRRYGITALHHFCAIK